MLQKFAKKVAQYVRNAKPEICEIIGAGSIKQTVHLTSFNISDRARFRSDGNNSRTCMSDTELHIVTNFEFFI